MTVVAAETRQDEPAPFGPRVTAALERDPRQPANEFVYFFITESGLVKIGRARNIWKRLAQLQIGNHETLSMIGSLAGGRGLELEIHELLADTRVRGEWFRGSDTLRALIWAAFHAAKREVAA